MTLPTSLTIQDIAEGLDRTDVYWICRGFGVFDFWLPDDRRVGTLRLIQLAERPYLAYGTVDAHGTPVSYGIRPASGLAVRDVTGIIREAIA